MENIDFITFSAGVITSYLIGAIPFAWIAGKIFRKGDIRKKGTGNVGGGNTMIVVGKVAGIIVLLLDIAKGALAAWIGLYLFNSTFALMIFGLAAITGHCNSIFLNFTGGKGVATTLGIYAIIDLKIFFLMYFIWAALVLTTKYTAINTVIMMIAYPFLLVYLKADFFYVLFSIFVAIVMTINHKNSIYRFITGKEKTMKEEIEYHKKAKPKAY